jgi:hypothetical protein
MHDRRVAVELDEFCRGTTLRANSELAEVWKLKDGVMAYMNYMHKPAVNYDKQMPRVCFLVGGA